MLFVQPIIYIYERLFGLVSDVSLLRISDTNLQFSKNFQIKLQVLFTIRSSGQFSRAAANEIGANTLLVRVGALYHDIGKLKAPIYFSENQTGILSPHEELAPKQSAESS